VLAGTRLAGALRAVLRPTRERPQAKQFWEVAATQTDDPH
jgi:hypothetical protein